MSSFTMGRILLISTRSMFLLMALAFVCAWCLLNGHWIYLYRKVACSNGCHQSDARLAKLIRERFIQPPSILPYNFLKNPPDIKGQIGQASFVDHLLGNQTSGFFVECGAHRGEIISNTLYFELERNWNGILIEADPTNFMHLLGKNRKVFSLGACLSIEERSSQMEFITAGVSGGIKSVPGTNLTKEHRLMMPEADRSVVLVQCFPIYAVLMALGNPVVDYFSLDVEGAEMGILKTIPWDKVNIKIWTIEFAFDEQVKKELTQYLTSKDYIMVKELEYDLVFAHKSVSLNGF